MRKRFLIAAAAVSIIGAVVAGISTNQFLRIERTGFEIQSFCAINEKINCDIVSASSYASFLGTPTAWWGFLFYILVLIFSLFAFFSKKDRRAVISILWFISIVSVFTSIYLGYISMHVLGVICIECLAMYAVNFILFALLFAAIGIPVGKIFIFARDYMKAVFGKETNLEFKPQFFAYAISFAALILIGWGLFAGSVSRGSKAPGVFENVSLDEKLRAFYMQSLYSIEPDPSWPVWGNPNAKVTIIEYSEFQCPFCRVAAMNLRSYLHQFRKDIRFYFANYPLDSACNDQVLHSMHPHACLAARAAVCAKERGDFWGYHDEIFRNQRKIGPELVIELAKKRGWNVDEFQSCLDSPETLAAVKKDIGIANKSYIDGTPSIIINNRRLKNWMDFKLLQAVVKEEIKKSKARAQR